MKSGRLFRGTYSYLWKFIVQYVLIVFKPFHRCWELNCVNVVFLLGQELNKEPSDTDSAMRAMLLLEPLLRSDIVKPEVLMMIDE